MPEQPITFERDGETRLLMVRRSVPYPPPTRGFHIEDDAATDDDLRAAGYVRLPSAEELARRMHAKNESAWPKKLRDKWDGEAREEYMPHAEEILALLTGGEKR